MKTVALRSLGCKVNAYETEGIQQILQQNGYIIVPFDAKADIYIVNTCSVTNIADRKSRQMLHKAKSTNPDAIVVACGCYVQTGLDILKEDDSVDIIIGNNEKNNVLRILKSYEEECAPGTVEKPLVCVRDMSAKQDYEEMHVASYSDRTRDFVKIQDGCDRFCTYCIIPYARGRVRSRQQDDVVDEVTGMVAGGCREVVLTGIHVSSYGADRGGSELLPLMRRLQDINGLERIRLSSLEPGIITPEFVTGIRELSKVCPHFHLSMQSGSAGVLKRMNRHYTPDEYFDRVELLRSVYDDPAITTDVIVGFPGETEAEFDETYRFIERVGFYELHVFRYSKRSGTPAASMPGQLTEREKAHRSRILIELGDRLAADYRHAHIGRHTTVLTEEYTTIGGVRYLTGHTPEYICVGLKDGTQGPNSLVSGIYGDPVDAEILTLLPDTDAVK
ncbi:MAG: tRNA (N(6)-L-threonylcarbamoyladenosine(37)-C(2))-methylthiotransferase MtaB [Lachnospiraceae bacterium]|nr:tRNA (N(6)-L-threonylcarbamoyladenosine(37)-C(2))-methylthiotransferase MtaB [Lachnospiraceae bacterium]